MLGTIISAPTGEKVIGVTLYDVASRYLGLKETPGDLKSTPSILAMLKLDHQWPSGDHTPWCSAFINHCAWLLDLPRSRHLSARSWLKVGERVTITEARRGFDVVILKRGSGPGSSSSLEPHADGSWPPGHVALFDRYEAEARRIVVLGGNQGDAVTVAPFRDSELLAIVRLLN